MKAITRNFHFMLAALALTQGSASAAPPQDAAALPFVSTIFGEHMVLQRGKPNLIWGWSQPGDSVRVEIAENSATATAAADGRWQARIQPPAPGGPYTLKISGKRTIELQDVLVGDVWICARCVRSKRDNLAAKDFIPALSESLQRMRLVPLRQNRGRRRRAQWSPPECRLS